MPIRWGRARLTHALKDSVVPRHLSLKVRQQRGEVDVRSLLHSEEELVCAAVVRATLVQVDLAADLPARDQCGGPRHVSVR